MENDHDKSPVYELVEMSENDSMLILNVNGRQSICPFQPAMPMVNERQQMTMGICPCSLGCPLATISRLSNWKELAAEKQPTHEFIIHCGGEAVKHEVVIRKFSRIEQGSPGLYIPAL